MWVFALILAIPLIEIALFIMVGGWLTLWPTLALVVASAIAGTMVLRWQGMQVVSRLRADAAVLRDPFSPLAHGALIFLAGLLLILPGFLSDFLGILLLIPVLRRALIGFVGRRIRLDTLTAGVSGGQSFRKGSPQDWEDAEFEEIGPDRGISGRPSGWTRH